MTNKENPDNRYKKMAKPATKSAGSSRKPAAPGTSGRKKVNQTRPAAPSSAARKAGRSSRNTGTFSTMTAPGLKPQGKTSAGQILVIILLSLILISLVTLVVFMFQPGRMQLWNSSRENPETIVRRLEPAQEESPLKPQPEAVEEIKQQTATEETKENAPAMRDSRIYFVKVNAEGQISLKSVTRAVDYSSSPLTQTINTLISGPGSDEINKGSLSLIPEGSRLLSARVENGTAYLNFNEAFRFNPLGREGYLAQLKQVVYTSTEFPSIKNVQIMIEGVIREYLGGEGFYIGEPLSRESFQNTQ
ncbi:MAG: GerMN domain-containing protein [Spirochaetales bacterium]|nr:GerMN domain-containing protein [Spirochaetales bacterium]